MQGAAYKKPVPQLSFSTIGSFDDQGTRITHSLDDPLLLFVDNLHNLAREVVGIGWI